MISNIIEWLESIFILPNNTGMGALFFIMISCFALGLLLSIFHFIKSLNILS